MQTEVVTGIQSSLARAFSPDHALFTASFTVPAHYIQKNGKEIRYNRATGKRFIGSSDKVLAGKPLFLLELQRRAGHLRLERPISHPVWCMFLFFYPVRDFYTKKGRVNKNLPDLSNLYEFPQDCLQKAGILEDDNLIKSHDFSRILPTIEKEPYIEMFIMKYEGAEMEPLEIKKKVKRGRASP